MYSSLKLEQGEINHYPVPKEKVVEYEACCYLEAPQIFLNRALSNETGNYRIFIATSESMHTQEYPAYLINDSTFTWICDKNFIGNKIKYNAFFVSKANFYMARINYNEPKSGLMVVYDFVSPDSLIAKNYYDQLETLFVTKISH